MKALVAAASLQTGNAPGAEDDIRVARHMTFKLAAQSRERQAMAPAQQPFTSEQIMERGREIYVERLRREVEHDENIGKFISIDIRSGDYEIGTSHLVTSDRLFERHPDAVISTLRIGYPATFSRGVRMRPVSS